LVLLSASLVGGLAVLRFDSSDSEPWSETSLNGGQQGQQGGDAQASLGPLSGEVILNENERISLLRDGDLREAMRVYERLGAGEVSDFEWIELSQRLAHSLPEQGLLWLVKIPSTEATRTARSAFGNALWAKDPSEALRLLDQVIKAGIKPDAYRGYASALLVGESKRSFEGSLNLLDRLIRLGGDQSSYLIGLGASLQSSGEYSKILMFAQASHRYVNSRISPCV
jgi:tetratricopeptide (TPR) repeat protein